MASKAVDFKVSCSVDIGTPCAYTVNLAGVDRRRGLYAAKRKSSSEMPPVVHSKAYGVHYVSRDTSVERRHIRRVGPNLQKLRRQV